MIFNVLIPLAIASVAALLFGRRRLRSAGQNSRVLPGMAFWLGISGVVLSGWIGAKFLHGLFNLGRVDSAIVTMRALVSAEEKFAEAHPDLGFTCRFSDLPSDPVFDALVKSPEKNGYTFVLQDCRSDNGHSPNTRYQVVARPLHPGLQAFCADRSGILRTDYDGSVDLCVTNGSPLGD